MKITKKSNFLRNGFRKCGFFRWNVDVINYNILPDPETKTPHNQC